MVWLLAFVCAAHWVFCADAIRHDDGFQDTSDHEPSTYALVAKNAHCFNRAVDVEGSELYTTNVGANDVEACAAYVQSVEECGMWFSYGYADGKCVCIPQSDGFCNIIRNSANYGVYQFVEASVESQPQMDVSPKIDTYVINLHERTDRCQCMAKQLASAPQAVFRQNAVHHTECDLHADRQSTGPTDDIRDHSKEFSLFCSNYKIWQRALASDADYIIVMEDDIVLASTFWERVSDFVSGCNDFGYVAIDSWANSGNPRPDACPSYRAVSIPEPGQDRPHYGCHAQLIRRAYLHKVIAKAKEVGMGPMDWWWNFHLNDGQSFSWRPDIVHQQDRLKIIANASRFDASACAGSVKESTLRNEFKPTKSSGGSSFLESATVAPRLTCR